MFNEGLDKELPFTKASGLGNDFVILDNRQGNLAPLSQEQICQLADRHNGIGCDQLILIEAANTIRFFNGDGSEAEACGNGARCVAKILLDETQAESMTLQTASGPLIVKKVGDYISVNMRKPRFEELTDEQASSLPSSPSFIGSPLIINVGNPHIVFKVRELQAVPVEILGSQIECHPLFPNRTNVGFAQILSPEKIQLIVWERGAGLTSACGTGACAAAFASTHWGFARGPVTVSQKGGDLSISWDDQNDLWMTGPAEIHFQGMYCLN